MNEKKIRLLILIASIFIIALIYIANFKCLAGCKEIPLVSEFFGLKIDMWRGVRIIASDPTKLYIENNGAFGLMTNGESKSCKFVIEASKNGTFEAVIDVRDNEKKSDKYPNYGAIKIINFSTLTTGNIKLNNVKSTLNNDISNLNVDFKSDFASGNKFLSFKNIGKSDEFTFKKIQFICK